MRFGLSPSPRGAKRQGDRTGGSANRNGYQKIVWSVYRLYPEQYGIIPFRVVIQRICFSEYPETYRPAVAPCGGPVHEPGRNSLSPQATTRHEQ